MTASEALGTPWTRAYWRGEVSAGTGGLGRGCMQACCYLSLCHHTLLEQSVQ